MGDFTMTAAEVLEAIRHHHRRAAIVSEVVISDHDWVEHFARETGGRAERRIDALMFASLQRTAIEIKVSKPDVARESWGKVGPWVRVTHRFVYAVPAGLIEHPPYYRAGLWWVYPDGRIEVRRKAKPNPYPEPLPQHVVQALAYRSLGRSPIDGTESDQSELEVIDG